MPILDESTLRIEQVLQKTDSLVAPVRTTIFKRYPTFFTLFVTLGLAATFLGLEQMLLKFSLLREYPELIFLLGIAILAVTGRLYKKLG